MGKEDFISEEPVKVEIDGKEFLIKEFSCEEADEINNKYISMNEDGKLNMDLVERNKAWLGIGVIDAPYGGINDRAFKDLKPAEKQSILNKLKPKIRLPLLQAISDLNEVEADIVKNYKRQS